MRAVKNHPFIAAVGYKNKMITGNKKNVVVTLYMTPLKKVELIEELRKNSFSSFPRAFKLQLFFKVIPTSISH